MNTNLMNLGSTQPLHANKENRISHYTNRVTSLGIPVDNLTLDEAVNDIFTMIENYQRNGKPHLVATLNVQFLVNSLGYRINQPRHPELMQILREADMVTADGFPIVLLSKLSGYPLKQRVTGADLTPRLCEIAAIRGKSVYLMGGLPGSADSAATTLKRDYPNLHIAGTDCPMVSIDGKKLASWDEDDAEVVEKINRSGADILFVGLGNPKQELWFSRNKHRLQVAVCVGVGGTFEFITGQVKRAPQWIQSCNVEWLYRITQDPKRLLSRYVIGMVKLGVLATPLMLDRLRYVLLINNKHTSHAPSVDIQWRTLWASRDDVLLTLRLPKTVTRHYMEGVIEQVNTSHNAAKHVFLIDFSRVEELDTASYEAICTLSRMFNSGVFNGLLVGLNNKLRQRLGFARVLDIINKTSVSLAKLDTGGMSNQRGAGFKTYRAGSVVFAYLYGAIEGRHLNASGFTDTLVDAASDAHCIIDLRQVSHIDSAAIACLIKLADAATNKQIQGFSIGGVNEHIHQMLLITKAVHDINILADTKFYDILFGG